MTSSRFHVHGEHGALHQLICRHYYPWFTSSVNGRSPSPVHQTVPGNLKDTNEQFESWDDEISTHTSPTCLRPIGAEHRATTSAGVTHTGMLILSEHCQVTELSILGNHTMACTIVRATCLLLA